MKDMFFKNRLCVIDTETSGLNPDQHDILQLAVIPLDYTLKPASNISLVNCFMRPDPDKVMNADPNSFTVTGHIMEERVNSGLDQGVALDCFLKWYESLNLGPKERILPIAHNWGFDSQFIRNWMGREAYEMVFHGHCRDTMQMALCLNDRAWWYEEELPYPRLALRQMCSTIGIPYRGEVHDAMEDCRLTLEIYKHLVSNNTLTRCQMKGH